jgi:AAA ATPase domain/Trypsin-like peptidase domain
VQTQAGKIKAEISYNLLCRSMVEIVTPRQKRIGFFVARDTILTCPRVLEDTKRESIEINQDGQTYKVLKYETNLNIDVTTIQVELDEDREVICAELDDSDRLGDELYLCPYYRRKSNIGPKRVDLQNNGSSNGVIKFIATQIDGMVSGAPLLNDRTGKVCGVVRLQSPKTIDRQNQIGKFRGEAISVDSIFKEFSEIKTQNNNFHQTKSLSNLPSRSYDRFIGRRSEIKQLLEYISPSHRQHMIVVDGNTGIGKTSLVTKVAYQCLQEQQDRQSNLNSPDIPTFDAIIYISLNNYKLSANFSSFMSETSTISLLRIIRTIANVLNAPDLKQVYDERKFNLAYKYLSQQSTLLIVDEIEDIGSDDSLKILDFLNNLPISTKAIITTREKAIFHSQISLTALSNQESQEFIQTRTDLKKINLTPAQIKQIWSVYNGVPLITLYAIGEYAARNSLESILDTEDITNKSNDLDSARSCFNRTLMLLDKQTYELLIFIAFFRSSASRDALIEITRANENNLDIEESLLKLQHIYPIFKSYVGKEERYNMLPATREYVLAELEEKSEKNPKFESELRARWIDWHKDFADKYGGHNMEMNNYNYYHIEQELENIGEVLSWCALHQKYYPIRVIWNNIDSYIEAKGYLMIRFYWWEYLEKEAQQRGETSFYVKALSEKISTWIEMGQGYYTRAINSLKEALNLSSYSDRSVQMDLKNSWEKLGGENFTGIDITIYQPFATNI